MTPGYRPLRTGELAGVLETTPATALRAIRQTARHHAYAVVPFETLAGIGTWLDPNGPAAPLRLAGHALVNLTRRLAPELGDLCAVAHALDLESAALVCLLPVAHDGHHGWEHVAGVIVPPSPEEQDAAAARIAARWKGTR